MGLGNIRRLFLGELYRTISLSANVTLRDQCGTCLLCPLWAYFRLPETKGRSFRELDILFEKRVPARNFGTTNVESGIGEDGREQLALAGDL